MTISRLILACCLGVVVGATPARAATATFVSPPTMSASDQSALSTAGDNSGYLIALNKTLGVVLDTPVGVGSGGSVSVFTLAPDAGRARAVIRIGVYNGGAPTIVYSRNFRSGQSRTFNNLAGRCSVLGGCDYIEIETFRTRGGAAGATVDYVRVDGSVLAVTGVTPEPSAWALMIVAFAGLALRLKHLRRRADGSASPTYDRAARCRPVRVSQPLFASVSSAAN